MRNILRTAQAAVAEQLSAHMSVNTAAVSKLLSAGAAAVVLAAGSLGFSSEAHAQNFDPAAMISNALGRAGQLVGQDLGRGQNMGNEGATILGTAAETAGKAATGQQIDGARVGQVLGGVIGAVAGYKGVGSGSQLQKMAGAAVVGGIGGVVGGVVGKVIDDRTQPAASNHHVTENDQYRFLESMKASAVRTVQGGYGASPLHHNQSVAFAVNATRMNLVPSGQQMPGDEVMANLARRAMSMVKVGEAYMRSNGAWNDAFATNAPLQQKEQINNAVHVDWQSFQAATNAYVTARNGAAQRGYNVAVMDQTIADRLSSMTPQQEYRMESSRPRLAYNH